MQDKFKQISMPLAIYRITGKNYSKFSSLIVKKVFIGKKPNTMKQWIINTMPQKSKIWGKRHETRDIAYFRKLTCCDLNMIFKNLLSFHIYLNFHQLWINMGKYHKTLVLHVFFQCFFKKTFHRKTCEGFKHIHIMFMTDNFVSISLNST